MATIVKRALRTAAGWATMSAPEKAVYDNIYYESLAAWEAAEGRNLVTADEIAELVVYNDKEWEASFTVLQVRNFPSDDTHFVRIIAHENDKFDYKLKTGAKLISNTSDTTWGFAVYNNCIVYVEDLGISIEGTQGLAVIATTAKLYFDRCVIYDTKYCSTSNVSFAIKLRNCYIEPSRASAGNEGGSPRKLTLENCTIIQKLGLGSYNGSMCLNTCHCTNVVIYNENPKGAYNNEFNPQLGSDYNAQNDNGSDDLSGSNSINTITLADFTDPANGDYSHVAGSQLEDTGANLSSEFTTDIIGTERVLPFDIGAFESATTSSATITGTGTAQADTSTATGSGTVGGVKTGSGSVSAETATAAGIGVISTIIVGSGNVQATTATASGTDADENIIHPGRIFTAEIEDRVYNVA